MQAGHGTLEPAGKEVATSRKISRMWRELMERADSVVVHYREVTTRAELCTEGAPLPFVLGAAAILKAGEAADVVAETGGAVAGAVGRVSWKVARAGGGVATTIGKRTGRVAGRVAIGAGRVGYGAGKVGYRGGQVAYRGARMTVIVTKRSFRAAGDALTLMLRRVVPAFIRSLALTARICYRSAIVAAALAAGGTYLIVRGSAKLVRLTATGVGRATNAGMLVVSATATGIENTAVVTYRVITASAAAGTRATAGGVRLICNSPSYAAGGYRAAVGGVHGGYVGVRRGCARAVGGVKAAGRGVVSVFTADYVGEVRRTRDRVVSIKDIGSTGTLRRGRAMPIFTLAASSLLHLGRVGPIRCMYEGMRLTVATADAVVEILLPPTFSEEQAKALALSLSSSEPPEPREPTILSTTVKGVSRSLALGRRILVVDLPSAIAYATSFAATGVRLVSVTLIPKGRITGLSSGRAAAKQAVTNQVEVVVDMPPLSSDAAINGSGRGVCAEQQQQQPCTMVMEAPRQDVTALESASVQQDGTPSCHSPDEGGSASVSASSIPVTPHMDGQRTGSHAVSEALSADSTGGAVGVPVEESGNLECNVNAEIEDVDVAEAEAGRSKKKNKKKNKGGAKVPQRPAGPGGVVEGESS